MAKNSIRDFDATSSNNTDIQSVDISEGCSPAGINNAIRELMTDLKNVSAGTIALESPSADSMTVTGDLTVDTTTLKVDSTNNRVGICTASPLKELHLHTQVGSTGDVEMLMDTGSGSSAGQDSIINSYRSNADLILKTNNSESMRIDSSGNVLVGTTDTTPYNNTSGGGFVVAASGLTSIARETTSNAQSLLHLNTTGVDCILAEFAKDGTTVGSIKCRSSGANLQIDTGQSGIDFGGDGYLPMRNGSIVDNNLDIGSGSFRYDDVFATNGTIQTSDQNEKQQIASLTDAEITAAKAISGLFKTFKWNDKVEAKGDAARTHAGVIAQEVQQAMTDAGLDAANYAFWCSNTWWETQTEVPAVEANEENGTEAQDAYTRTDTYNTKDEAPEGAAERTRLGVRYPELLAFVGAATEQRLTHLETLEARIEALENA